MEVEVGVIAYKFQNVSHWYPKNKVRKKIENVRR